MNPWTMILIVFIGQVVFKNKNRNPIQDRKPTSQHQDTLRTKGRHAHFEGKRSPEMPLEKNIKKTWTHQGQPLYFQ